VKLKRGKQKAKHWDLKGLRRRRKREELSEREERKKKDWQRGARTGYRLFSKAVLPGPSFLLSLPSHCMKYLNHKQKLKNKKGLNQPFLTSLTNYS